MRCDVGKATEGLETELWRSEVTERCSFSNLPVTSPTSQLILLLFRCFTYVTDHSPTFLSLLLRHKLFTYVTWRTTHGGINVTSHPVGPCLIPVRINFLVKFYPWFFLNCKTNFRKFRPHVYPDTICSSFSLKIICTRRLVMALHVKFDVVMKNEN